MNALVAIIAVAAFAFVATNIDNLALLVLFLLRYQGHRAVVGAAYLVGLLLIGLLSFLIGLLAGSVPVNYLGLLGLVPIAIGITGILHLIRGSVTQGETSENQPMNAVSVFGVTLTTQLGNGTDTILTLAALFGDTLPGADYLILLTIAVMAVLFLYAGNYLAEHPVLSDLMQRHAHRVTPFVLILVGLYILANTGSDLVPG